MKILKRTCICCIVISMLFCPMARAQQVQPWTHAHARSACALLANPDLEHNPFTVLVKFKANADPSDRTRAISLAGTQSSRPIWLVPGLELLYIDKSPEVAVRALRQMRGVEYAELDLVMHIDQGQRFPSDPTFFPFSWGMHNDGTPYNFQLPTAGADVNAPEAWYVNIGNPNFTVAIIDTGIQWTHHNLNDNAWSNSAEMNGLPGIDDDQNGYVDDVRGWDFSANDNNPMDENGHGTHVAGTVGAEEGGNEPYKGVVGMMWQCRLIPLRVFDANGNGYISDAALALQYAVQKGVKVSNHSYGFTSGSSNNSLRDVIAASQSIGHICVASAGNGGSDGIGDDMDGNRRHYPATFELDNVIAVAAIDMHDERASFSNFGQTSIDLGAPGVYILSSYLLDWGGPGYHQRFLDGTSMAAPHVTGAVGLVYCQYPSWTYQQVRSRIIGTARPVPSLAGITVSGGVLDAAGALGVVVPPPPPIPPAIPGAPIIGSLGGGILQIKWQDNSTDETMFAVQREKWTGSGWSEWNVIANPPANTTSITDSPGRGVFRYHVLARNSGISSAWSAWTEIKN